MALYLHRAIGVTPGETWQWTLHTTGSASIGTAADAWETALTTWWTTVTGTLAIQDLYPSTTGLREAVTVSIEETTGRQLQRQDRPLTLDGTSADAALPPQVAMVTSLRTQVATRAGRGRYYMPAPATTALTMDGRISTTAVDSLVGGTNAFMSTLAAVPLTVVIVHRADMSTTPVTSGSIGDVFDTQRRRRNKLTETRAPITI